LQEIEGRENEEEGILIVQLILRLQTAWRSMSPGLSHPLLPPLALPFPHHVHDFVSLEGSPRGLEGKEAHPRLRQSLDEAMILFDQIVEVLALPQFHVVRQGASRFEISYGFGIRHVFIDSDHMWGRLGSSMREEAVSACPIGPALRKLSWSAK
jgi:hypothetical protein